MLTVTRVLAGAWLIGLTSGCAPVRKVEFNPINGIRARAILGKRLVGSEVEKQWIEALGEKSFSQEGAVILIRRPDGKTLRSCCDITSQVVVINGPLSTFRAETASAIRHLRGPLVFCRPDGSPLKIWHLHERLWGACRCAGLRKIRWHDLRHSFASQLVIANVPLRQVQAWLGHSTITMTMRYANLAPDSGRNLIDVLDVQRDGTIVAPRARRTQNNTE